MENSKDIYKVRDNIDSKKYLSLLTIFVSFLYLSGYLIANTHLSHIGVKDIGAFIKLKYIYIGIIYLSFCFPALPILCIFYVLPVIRKKGDIEKDAYGHKKLLYKFSNRIFYAETIVLILLIISLFCIAFVFLLFFSLHGRMKQDLASIIVISVNFFIIFLIPLSDVLVRNFKRFFPKENQPHINLRYVIIALFWGYSLIIMLNIIVFSDIFHAVYRSLINNMGFNFFITLALMGVFLGRGVHYIGKLPERRSKYIIWAMSPFLFILYFLNILTFALYIYPFIPVERGGANYSMSPSVVIRPKLDNNISIETIKSIESDQIKMIEDNDNSMYLSIGSWKNYLNEMKLSNLPRIIKIGIEDIELVEIKHDIKKQ